MYNLTGACFDQDIVPLILGPVLVIVSATVSTVKWLNPVSSHGYCSITGRRLIQSILAGLGCLDPLLCILAVSLDIRNKQIKYPNKVDQSWLVHRLNIMPVYSHPVHASYILLVSCM